MPMNAKLKEEMQRKKVNCVLAHCSSSVLIQILLTVHLWANTYSPKLNLKNVRKWVSFSYRDIYLYISIYIFFELKALLLRRQIMGFSPESSLFFVEWQGSCYSFYRLRFKISFIILFLCSMTALKNVKYDLISFLVFVRETFGNKK